MFHPKRYPESGELSTPEGHLQMTAEAGNRSQTTKPSGGRAVTATIRRWIESFGEYPNFSEIAEATGLLRHEVSYVLREVRHTEHIQRKVADYAGLPVGELFGDAAWFRRLGAELEKRRADRRAS